MATTIGIHHNISPTMVSIIHVKGNESLNKKVCNHSVLYTVSDNDGFSQSPDG